MSSLLLSRPSSISKSKFIWRFPPSKFDNLPSCNSKQLSIYNIESLSINDELIQRQKLSIFIYELGSHLNVSFNCIYTSIIYMHRFFMLHPFQQCVKESVGTACLFLACKVHEMPRPLNEFTRNLYKLINKNSEDSLSSTTDMNITSDILSNYNQQIIDYENMLLSTLGFCLNVEQPYMIISKTSQILSLPIEIAQKAYEIATKSIFFTLFSMKYTINLIACFALYLAITSSQINILDNQDGSQWFHLLNEEFTEKLLKELSNEYERIFMDKYSKICQQRYEEIREEKKVNYQQSKLKSNNDQSNSKIYTHDDEEHHYPIATTSGSVRSTTSSSSSSIQQQFGTIRQTMEINHHTPNNSYLRNISHNDKTSSIGTNLYSSPTIPLQSSSSPQQNKNNFNGQYNRNNSSILMSSGKPIPTLMGSSNSNVYNNSINSRYSNPIFKYPSTSPAQHIFRPSFHSQHIHYQYPSNNFVNSSYYPQQQTPLFYHSQEDSSNIHNKRYSEPPAAPMKRFRYNINTHQHY